MRAKEKAVAVELNTGQLEWLPWERLMVDPRLHGPIRTRWIKEHLDSFDANAFGTLIVSARKDKTFAVMDGRHRYLLVAALGWTDQLLPCVVLRGLTFEQEARLFVDLNGERIRPQTIDIFLQEVNAKDPVAVEIVAIAAEMGLTIGRGSHDANIQAASALQRVFAGDRRTGAGRNPKVLRDVLWTIVNAWGKDSSNFNGALMQGLGMVYMRDGAIADREAMATKLSAHGTVAKLLGMARTMRDANGWSLPRAVAGTVTDVYNRKQRINKLNSWWA